MATYLQLEQEQVWKDQIVPPNMTNTLIKPLRIFYNMSPALIGAPGDNNHLRGRHRSRNWDLQSIYCTNRSYGTTDTRDKAGDGNWYRAIDIGIKSKTLFDASHRMDALVRSGKDNGRVAEWFGTFDGQTVVGWFQGHESSSDESHLYHLHIGIWTKYANDTDLMQLLYDTVTGTIIEPEVDDMVQMLIKNADDNTFWIVDGQSRRPVPLKWIGDLTNPKGPITNAQVHQAGLLGNLRTGTPGTGAPGTWVSNGQIFVTSGDMDVWGIEDSKPDSGSNSGMVTGFTDDAKNIISELVDEQLDQQSIGGADKD